MATKAHPSVEYYFPMLAALPDAIATNLSQITLYLPENAKSFKSVIVDVVMADINTTLANITQRQIEVQLGSAGYSASNNVQAHTQSGENFAFGFSADFASYFNTNWSGTSMTMDCRLTVNTGTLGCANVSVKVVIDYDYDDVSDSYVKTIWIPLNAPTGALGISKPGSPNDTIELLDTYCPEGGKIFRQTTIIVQGNTEGNGAVDKSISFEIDNLGPYTSTLFELGSTIDLWYRITQPVTFLTNSTHSFYIWGSTADFDHPHVWMAVTYEFDPDPLVTTQLLEARFLPMEMDGAMGFNSGGAQRSKRDLWIPSPGPITTKKLACFVHFTQSAAISGINARIGTGSYVAYTSVASVLAGQVGFMIRNDSAYTLQRGRNELSVDIYRTESTDLGQSLSSFWLINYTCGVSPQGVSHHPRLVQFGLDSVGTGGATIEDIVLAKSRELPEADYFFSSIGVHLLSTTNSTGFWGGTHIGAERLVAEGGYQWEQVYETTSSTDAEVGIMEVYCTARTIFKRWANEFDPSRLDIETARRWRVTNGANCGTFNTLYLLLEMHDIIFTVSGTITGFSGTVDLWLCRAATGERVLHTQRTGDGSYSFNWYDDTELMYVEASDGTNFGRSSNQYAS